MRVQHELTICSGVDYLFRDNKAETTTRVDYLFRDNKAELSSCFSIQYPKKNCKGNWKNLTLICKN